MTAAEQLRREILSSNSIDKNKVLESVRNGILKSGKCLVWDPYDAPKKTVYNDGSIEVASLEDATAIKEYVIAQGFRVKRAYHPASGREYGFEVML